MTSANPQLFRVGLTADFYDGAGQPLFKDMGLSLFADQPHIDYFVLPEPRQSIGPDQIRAANALIVLAPSVTAETVSEAANLLAIGRFGVGYDNVDVAACTAADVLLFITAGAVDRSVAEATIGWMLALGHHVRAKDQLIRRGQWAQKNLYMGRELRDRTFGAIGLGGIARETIRLLSIFGMNQPLAYDPYVDANLAAALNVKLVSLDTLLAEADFVSIHCPLTEDTANLIGQRELALMKPDAYLLNTARGGIVNEDALFTTLQEKRIAGAAIDCFVGEPITAPHRFGLLDNVLLAPHCIAWTDEIFRDIGRAVCRGLVDLNQGRQPAGVINPEVFDRPGFQAKWQRLRRWG
jgi:phosphoglycerate dehydrogenase-like enzyme